MSLEVAGDGGPLLSPTQHDLQHQHQQRHQSGRGGSSLHADQHGEESQGWLAGCSLSLEGMVQLAGYVS